MTKRDKRYEMILRELPDGSWIARPEKPADGGGTGARRTGHHDVIYLPDGAILRERSGLPLTVPYSPSDRRSMLNCRARVRRALRERV